MDFDFIPAFVLPKFLKFRKTTTLCGSPLYMAPEIFEGKPYGRSVDWWSMGIIVFEMIHGLAPFDVADRGNTKVWDHFHIIMAQNFYGSFLW